MHPDPLADPLLGFDLGDFIVEEYLATGGMGRVYRGRQKPPIEQAVAIKFLHSHYAEEPEIVARFRNEAYVSGLLNRPNIVRVLAYGELEGRPYLVMEYVEGTDLGDLQERHGPFPVALALLFLRETALALADAHRHNVIHRDIKPSNVLVARSGDVKLADFGIARAKEGSTITQPGGLLGSVPYMSPEQIRRVRLEGEAGKLSDIFSMGILSYELLAGERPFQGEGIDDIMDAIQTWNPRHLSETKRGIPIEVATLVHRMLEKEPADRCPELGVVVDILDRAVPSFGVQGARQIVADYLEDPGRTAKRLKSLPIKGDLGDQTRAYGHRKDGTSIWHQQRPRRLFVVMGAVLLAGLIALAVPLIKDIVGNLRTSARTEPELESQAGTITPDAEVTLNTETRLSIQTAPTGAAVVIDGQPRGQTPLTVVLSGDSADVALTHPGYQSHREKIGLTAGDQTFVRELAQTMSYRRKYRVNTWPSAAKVYVDGDPTPHELAFDVILDEGEHRFRVVRDDMDRVLRYKVRKGDPANFLSLDYEDGKVRAETRPQ